ncbi:MAG TPA: PTS sugar transporter subunit IIC [Gemmatimonadaceae bacterium]|nr:PTS sugar transporter subunit IIC [Gemmatimonadaceae bacterium]
MPDLLPFALLGAVFGLDVVSFPQAMISRPIVAATAGGALAGDTSAGLLAGVVLELMAMETLPVGASRYPEWGTASVAGGALAASLGIAHAGTLAVAALAAVLTAWVGGWSMYGLRKLNGAWAARRLPALEAGDRRALAGLQIRGLTADLTRGALVTVVALVVWRPVGTWLVARWSLPFAISRAVLVAVAGAVAWSAVWRLAHGAPSSRWYLIGGLAMGLAAMVLL